jgi:integrase/recombinase XerD
MKSEDMLEEFARHLRVERGLSPNTEAAYGYQLRGYFAFMRAKGRELAAATRQDVLAYLEALKERGLRRGSRYAAVMAMRQFHRFMAEARSCSDPTVGMRLPKLEQRLPRPLSPAQMDQLLQRPWSTKFRDLRDRALLELLYATGLRVSELVGIKEEELHLEGSVRVMGKGGKERVVPFGEAAKRALEAYLAARQARFPQGRSGVLFVNARGGPLRRGGVWWRLRRLGSSANVVRLFPHRIRHSAATHMLAGGADLRVIQEYLGHNSLTTTQRYTHVDLSMMRAACGAAHPAFR